MRRFPLLAHTNGRFPPGRVERPDHRCAALHVFQSATRDLEVSSLVSLPWSGAAQCGRVSRPYNCDKTNPTGVSRSRLCASAAQCGRLVGSPAQWFHSEETSEFDHTTATRQDKTRHCPYYIETTLLVDRLPKKFPPGRGFFGGEKLS
jgi:hypothetical protein